MQGTWNGKTTRFVVRTTYCKTSIQIMLNTKLDVDVLPFWIKFEKGAQIKHNENAQGSDFDGDKRRHFLETDIYIDGYDAEEIAEKQAVLKKVSHDLHNVFLLFKDNEHGDVGFFKDKVTIDLTRDELIGPNSKSIFKARLELLSQIAFTLG